VDVASELRRARLTAGLSQAALADRAGTSQSAVARYETGAAAPGVPTLERLLDACHMRLMVTPARRPLSALRAHRSVLLQLAGRHGARNLRLFGSAARGDAGPESDIDLLIDLEPGRTLLDLVAFRREATELLGLPVDIATAEMLREPVRRAAERDAVPL
jgi:predicted nucleotidyltransferase